MYYLLEHIDKDIKNDKAEIRTQQLIKLITGEKEIQKAISGVPD